MTFDNDEPCYVISIVAKTLGVHAQTLRYYEKVGLVEPSRSQGRIRLYSNRDIERLRLARTLMDDLGVNVAGVDIILRLKEHMASLEAELAEAKAEIKRLREAGI